jgi:membrane protein required for colicin V production
MMWLDYALLIIVALSALYSVFRGFVREVLSLIGWVLSFWVAIKFSDYVAGYLEGIIEIPGVRFAAAFLLLFLGIMIGSIFVSRLVVNLVRMGGLRGFDRFVGAGFGVARGLIIITVLVLLGGLSPLSQESVWQQSLMVPYLQKFATWATDNIPEEVINGVNVRAQALL